MKGLGSYFGLPKTTDFLRRGSQILFTKFILPHMKDLTSFDEGDQTQVGEHGIALSGGQKTRISLARYLL